MPADGDPLDALREASGLSVDEEGRFLHRGEPITHPRTLEVLWGSLARDGAGRWRVTVGREQGFVQVEETPWVVRALRVADGAVTLRLAGGREAPLDPATLRVARDGVLRCRVLDEPVRFSRGAQIALGFALQEDPARIGCWVLELGGVRWPVPGEPHP